ncbi:MAG: HupE/UreJ family protein [Reyranella sp.]|uniref:HupE/UreJ family protein n=1 Tax=Reyranella sp. TaxID=1929291 RepID=UPI001ACACCD4|nr:HupE/UreJ family protein [Reyranella sp.]MBN9089304.1 HupE/UreJ family protein [Reyranella sp.]
MRWLLTALLVLLAVPASAHVTSTGLAVVEVDGGRLAYRLTLVAAEQEGENVRLLEAAVDGDTMAAERMAAAMRQAARFALGGEACAPGRIRFQGSRTGDGKVVMEMALACPKAAGALLIRDDWSDVLGSHFQTVMSVRPVERPSVELVFNAERREAAIDLGAGRTGWVDFIVMGAAHILSGPDHLLFLLALLALAKGFWPIVRIVTGFTIAHSITLSLAALGVVDVSGRIVEPLIAATIIWVALENLLAPAQTRWRWLIAAVFGLVHGLGFASGLTELGLPREAMVRALVGFNVGVELGQLAFVAVVMPPLVWLARPGRLAWLPQVLSVLVAVMGAVWLVERVLA